MSHSFFTLNYKKLNLFFVICIILISFIPQIARSKSLNYTSWLNLETKKSFPSNNLGNSSGLIFKKNTDNIDVKINLTYTKDRNLFYDDSFLETRFKNNKFGIGKISRNWSFSPITSLILSKNARPSDSVYFITETKENPDNRLFSWLGPSSFELFNSKLTNHAKNQNPMLLGIRAVINPFNNFKFELVKTSQWGGTGHESNIPSFLNAVYGNSNENKSSAINQMAGFGFSFENNRRKNSSRIYGQLIGEDEAGGFPSCFMNLFGSEFIFSENKLPTTIVIEYVDTRIGYSSNLNCGPGTSYNNWVYKYTNYDVSLGAPIDTDGKSISLWGKTKLTKNTDIIYRLQKNLINDNNMTGHRLSSTRTKTIISELGISWKLNKTIVKSNIIYQDHNIDQINTPRGMSINFKTQYSF